MMPKPDKAFFTPPDPARGHRFAVVIPVYNHGQSVARVIAQAKELDVAVIAVDDGSTDDTPRRLAGIKGIQVISHPENKGKGAAIKTGMTAAGRIADWAVTMDADGQHKPKDARVLMAAAARAGRALIIGRRIGMDHPHVKWSSRMGRKFSNFWVRACGGPKVADSQSGFRAYPLPEALNWGACADHFDFEVEILVRARWQGADIREVPVAVLYLPPHKRISHFRPWRDFLRNAGVFTRLMGQRFVRFLRQSAGKGGN